MDKIVIDGGTPLKGEIKISGAKNSAIKLMVLPLLTDQPVELTNMPNLRDTRSMAGLLRHLGVTVEEGPGARMFMHAPKLASTEAPYDLVRKMRATFNVLGPLLAREHKAKVSLPGGCAIGARPVDLHLKALEAMGAKIDLVEGYVVASAKGGLKGADITFPFISVGATEHAILAAVLAKGETTLNNAAREPEIIDLANALNAMGARITGAGRSEIQIVGVKTLSGVSHSVVPDRIEAGTYALAAATAGGSVRLVNVRSDHLGSLWPLIAQAGAKVTMDETSVLIERNPKTRLKPVDVETQAYPGFPTDLRASASLIAAGLAAEGTTHISRVYHLDRGFEHIEVKLGNCGANIRREKE